MLRTRTKRREDPIDGDDGEGQHADPGAAAEATGGNGPGSRVFAWASERFGDGAYGEKDKGRSMKIRYSDDALHAQYAHPIARVHPETVVTVPIAPPAPIRHISALTQERTAHPGAVERAVELLTLFASDGEA